MVLESVSIPQRFYRGHGSYKARFPGAANHNVFHDSIVVAGTMSMTRTTSIDEIVQRPDVIDRSIFPQLQSIAPSCRRREQNLCKGLSHQS
jgi:hypothetical protein